MQIGIAARTGQRIGALNGFEQLACVGVVLDGDDRCFDDGQAAVSFPLVATLHGVGQAFGEANRVLLQLGDAIALARVVGVEAERRRK